MPATSTTRKKRGRPKKVDKTTKVDSEVKAANKDKSDEVDVSKLDAGAQTPVKLPSYLEKKLEAHQKLTESLMKEVEDFKAHPHTMPGDIPVELRGLQGPGNRWGTRSLNFIDPQWIDPNVHVRWSHKTMVDYHRGQGYTPMDYDEFINMIRARGGDADFIRTANNHVQIGDLILIKTSRDNYEDYSRYIREKTAGSEKAAKGALYSKGHELGMEVNEGDAGPKVERILALMEKEFGPQIREHFLK